MELNNAGPAVPVGGTSDRELWARAVDGDREAFGQIFDRHGKTVYNYLFRRTADWSEAEDLTSTVCLHAWRRRSETVLDRDPALPWPAAPSDRDLPNHRRTREELLMEDRSRGQPCFAATRMGSAARCCRRGRGGERRGRGRLQRGRGCQAASRRPRRKPDERRRVTESEHNARLHVGRSRLGAVVGPYGFRPGRIHHHQRGDDPIDAGTVAKILASCLGSDASRYHAVAAARAPVASQDGDGVVIAVNSADQYVQCQSKGDKGNSRDSPPTFINNRLWGTGHTIEYFDSVREPVGKGRYLMLGAGHYKSNIAKVAISYGDDPKQYPAVMAGGAFVYAAALSTDNPGPHYAGPSPYVHAFNASGEEIYNQKKDPHFTDQQ
ncbi:RNA polymerase sigma factor [Streptomyces sp. NBC_01180]|uniref:RNA polymerase sigma factor n=1 Tax=Streptomyces sp. NBC_01180 TaxID=2903763 RepID=UPI00386E6050|nr:hypothetical protein OG708_26630 [Streptomyces sp. NBC_01180]